MTEVTRRMAQALVCAAILAAAGIPSAQSQEGRSPEAQTPSDQRPDNEGKPMAGKLAPELAAEARQVLVDWLECEECTDGQLERVVELGSILTPSLAITLREGPSPASRELLRRELNKRYEELVAYRKTHPERVALSDRRSFVQQYMDNFEALYRVRAARGLAAIGTPAARRALAQAAQGEYRADVQQVIKESLERMR